MAATGTGGGGIQRGRNRSGLSGVLVDLPTVSAAKFHGDCYGWSMELGGTPKPRLGRTSTTDVDYRWMSSAAQGVLFLDKPEADWIAPDHWKGERGSIVKTIHKSASGTERKVTLPIMVTKFRMHLNEKGKAADDVPKMEVHWVATGPAVFAGWPGTQPAAATPTRVDMQQWVGTVFTKDPSSLQSAASIVVDWFEDIANTNDAETNKLDAAIGGFIAPFTGMKLRTAAIGRDAIDGGTITYQCGLTTTAEDAINEATNKTLDPNSLASTASPAAFNAPPPPSTGDAFVRRSITFKEFNDGEILQIADDGLRDTVDDQEMPDAGDQTDPLDIDTTRFTKKVFDPAAGVPTPPPPPAGLKALKTHVERINRVRSRLDSTYAKRDSADERGFAREHSSIDPQHISDDAIRWKVWTEGDTPPAAPDSPPTNNIKVIASDDIRLTPTTGGVSGQFLRWFLYGPKNSRDEQVIPNTSTGTDPQGLENKAVRAGLDGETIADPGPGFVLREIGIKPVTVGLGINRTLFIRVYGVRSTLDDRQMPERFANADPLRIDSDGRYRDVYPTSDGEPADPTPTLPELQNVGKKVEEIDQVHSQKTTTQDVLNSVQKRTFPKITTGDDPNNIDDDGIRAQSWTGSPPADPDDPPTHNVKLILRTDAPLTPGNANTPAVWMRIWVYGAKDSADKLILPNYETVADPSGLESTAVRAALDGQTISDPGAGYVLRATKNVPVTLGLGVNRMLTVRVYGVRTTKQDEEYPGTWTKTDTLGLDGRAQQTDVYNPGILPVPPINPQPGLQVVLTHVEQRTPDQVKRVVTFAVLTSEQERGFPKVETIIDPQNLGQSAVRYKFFTHGGAAPAAPDDPPTNNVKLIHTSDHRFSPTKDMRLFVYGAKNTRDDAVLSHVETTTDASELTSTAVRAGLDGETISPPGGDFVERDTKVVPLTDGLGTVRTLTIIIYGLVTRQTEIENQESAAEAGPADPYTRKNTTIVDWTSTDDALTDSLLSANQNDITFQTASSKLLTGGKAQQTITTAKTDKRVHSARPIGDGEDYVRARPLGAPSDWDNVIAIQSFFGNTAAELYIVDTFVLAGQQSLEGRAQPFKAFRMRSSFAVHRRFTGVLESNLADYLHLDAQNAVNADEFYGHPPHSVRYMIPTFEFSGSVSGSRVLDIDYHFNTDSLLWMMDDKIGEGHVSIVAGGASITNPGFKPATLFGATFLLRWPRTWSFDIFSA